MAVVFSKPPTSGPVWMLTGEQAKDIRHVVKPDVEGLAIIMESLIQGDQLYDTSGYLLSFF